MNTVDIKRKLRELKRLEQKIRYEDAKPPKPSLVWDAFFALQETDTGKAKYTLDSLAGMDREAFKKVVSEYWSFVYNAFFQENGWQPGGGYDTNVLLQWGLPAGADEAAVKRKFRELAKLYHPDTGGDTVQFIAFMEDYKKLVGKR